MATDPRVETIALLRSIDASLKALLAQSKPGGGAPAEQVDLDGRHGNPIVKAKDPRDWTGESMKGRHFSECPPEYLDLLADRFDYFASKEEDAKKAKYNRLDAARARGWAARLRAGYVSTTGTQDGGNGNDGEHWSGASEGDGYDGWGAEPKW